MCLGIPGKLTEVYTQDGLPMGKVEFGGITKEACLSLVPESRVGQYVLVHVGFVLNVIDEAEAEEIFSYLKQIDEAAELERQELEQQEPDARQADPTSRQREGSP